ncbi:hypothetical protein GALMADRAFT_76355 [Galerina marginata CBS 339.88]|uniref:GH16 domain-containing protein n=1 Tax=Galerina marginata (strain CBS 339.88) TaxID=685588 RepID=A0A067SH45_GALM3|nr:hypothetical protein GALMADRAFT_76355 [Galerina marginata CBS 339.88]
MGDSGNNSPTGSLPRSSSSNSLYKSSAAANMQPMPTAVTSDTPPSPIPRNSSVHSFRAPFLSPASRPTSSLWLPPSYSNQYSSSIPLATATASPTASTSALPLTSPFATAISKSKPPLPSTRLVAPLHPSEKPWLAKSEPRSRISYFITLFFLFLGIGGAAVLCFLGVSQVDILDPNDLCLVLDDEFSGSSLDTTVWTPDVELGGFGNGEFEMTTADPDNLYVSGGELYLMPTFTSDKVPNLLNGANYTLSGCTSSNKTACSATSNAALGTVINPVQSARLTTKGKKSIKFGKVEVRAKLPTGDWLWPAIWMLPTSSPYGAWPLSGEIDILEARGNAPSYPAQGNNVVRSTLTYGPFPSLLNQIYGWFSIKRSPSPNPAIGAYAAGFHTYTLEWTEDFIRLSVDSKLHAMLLTETKAHAKHNSYWLKAGFPQTAHNSSDGSGPLVVVQDPYNEAGATRAAPFDQDFYLILDLAVGGTSGWFPDGKGGKPWFDGSVTAMRDFARAQDTWGATWPKSAADRAFRIDYVKMWEKCK